MPYHHLTRDDRVALGALLRVGTTQAESARQLGVHRSTITREQIRNTVDPHSGYDVRSAGRLVRARRKRANARFLRLENDPVLAERIVWALQDECSPDQVVCRLRETHGRTPVGTATIYRWIQRERKDLFPLLRRGKDHWRRKRGTKQREKRREEAKKKRITLRPAVVEDRSRLGDWEGDTVIGKDKKARILTHVDRASGYAFADLLTVTTAQDIRKRAEARFCVLPSEKKHTLTYDNGTEFSDHALLEHNTGIPIYFCHPYHSWERGTNENWNGLLRQYFPKGTDFRLSTQTDVDRAVERLNNRPRKRLHYKTPAEVFFGRTDVLRFE